MVPIGIRWFLFQSGLGATAHLEAGGFIRSREGVPHPNIQFHFLPSGVIDHGRKPIDQHAYQVSTQHLDVLNQQLSTLLDSIHILDLDAIFLFIACSFQITLFELTKADHFFIA